MASPSRHTKPLTAGQTRPGLRPSLTTRFRRVRLLLCDVDGVMTDGAVFMGPGGEFKQYYVPDGLGLVLLRRNGIRVGWISARPSPATEARAADLKIDYLAQPTDGKLPAAEAILAQADLKWEEVCYVGDDIVDLALLRRAGVAMAPANSVLEVRALVHHVTEEWGGWGAIRAVAEMILQAQGKWESVVTGYAD